MEEEEEVVEVLDLVALENKNTIKREDIKIKKNEEKKQCINYSMD